MKFSELKLSEPIVRAVADKGYDTPSPIQAQAIPVALEGRDILGCAQTGTGKTCAFALPVLQRLSDTKADHSNAKRKGSGHGRAPRALVLCPTRELAMQIFDSFVDYGKHLKLRHTVVFGGVSQGKQVRDLRAGIDVLVATPGRLLDLINQGHIDLSKIEVLVLDEADRMLDMGFIVDIRKVVNMISPEAQTLFFSATVSREIRKLADSILDQPVTIETVTESTTADSIAQRIYMVDKDNKPDLLVRMLTEEVIARSLIFSRTKYGADKLVKMLRRSKIEAEAIHGDKSQNARTRAMRRFKSGSTKVLIATDIASRGIDVDNISHVFNYDMPIDPETYVHRIGRTARAGASGIAISFCAHDEISKYRSIERRSKITIEVGEDYEDLTFDAPPPSRRSHSDNRSGGRSGGRGGKSFGGRGGRDGGGGGRSRNPRNGERSFGGNRSERPDRSERSDRPERTERSDRPRAPRNEQSNDRVERSNDRKNQYSMDEARGARRNANEQQREQFDSSAQNTEGRIARKKPISKHKGSSDGKPEVKFGSDFKGKSDTNPAGKKTKPGKKKVGAKKFGKRGADQESWKPKKGGGYPRNKPGTGVRQASKKTDTATSK